MALAMSSCSIRCGHLLVKGLEQGINIIGSVNVFIEFRSQGVGPYD